MRAAVISAAVRVAPTGASVFAGGGFAPRSGTTFVRHRPFGANRAMSAAPEKFATEDGDSLLLTPGPLTTSPTVKSAMLHDFGSRDKAFVDLTRSVRSKLVSVLSGDVSGYTAVPLQGSGTFAVEAMLSQFVPKKRNGKLLILSNGAYGRRMANICSVHGISHTLFESAEDAPLDFDDVRRALDDDEDDGITHVAVVTCETTTGVLNPVERIANLVRERKKDLLIDAMSSFGAVDLNVDEVRFAALAASSNKGLQAAPGVGFVICDASSLSSTAGNADTLVLDLHDQWRGFERTGEWRFTPPTHVLLSLGRALEEFEEEGGTEGRNARYSSNCRVVVDGMRSMGFETLIPDGSQAPVIVTFRLPSHPKFEFGEFYGRLSERGYLIYPGKVATAPSFRVGCIGHVFPRDLEGFLEAVRGVLVDMDVDLRA